MNVPAVCLLSLALISTRFVQPVEATNPYGPPPVEVPLDSPFADLAIKNALPQFGANGMAEPAKYHARVLQYQTFVTVWMFDMANCQPSHGRRSIHQPVLFITLSKDATSVTDSRVKRVLSC